MEHLAEGYNKERVTFPVVKGLILSQSEIDDFGSEVNKNGLQERKLI